MADKALIVGLTGGIGSGKTLVSDTFASFGVPIIDADVIARQVVAPGSTGLAAIAAHFGPDVLTAEGQLDRSALRQRVFTNDSEKQWLNSCLHPLIRTAMQAQINAVTAPYAILAVPLLLENNLQHMVDRIAVVDCSESLQLSRALRRDGSSETVIKGIMASQVSRNERRDAADDIIDNSGDIAFTRQQVEACHQRYIALADAR
ncbi:dephospho-CoA kinase [Alteromonas gilva]|uniref:Dephospho-CoA kinase n=1 Tax=Alteromonas gilva TaxID=2987522 RepID=A0ABT5KZH7_9ALTE|nr:dephospho-CoA kinase [Alteromonas gilva]MDC8830174.1 dephospho-CoA kinase [Alteromonas gilva]